MLGLVTVLILAGAGAEGDTAGDAAPAPEPRWVAPVRDLAWGDWAAFRCSLALGEAPDRALLRVAAAERYRLLINGTGIAVADTPWDAETYDVTRQLRAGENAVEVQVNGRLIPEPAMPNNCWIWLRHDLQEAGSFQRLSFRTSGARYNEWVYVEIVDAEGVCSGLYCLEKGRKDLVLGTSGEEVEHVIELAREPRLPYHGSGDCDFTRIKSVRLRVDQKRTQEHRSGEVRFSDLKLQGETTLDITRPGAWRIEDGQGELRGSTLTASDGDASLILRYDFTPRPHLGMALDLRAWREGRQIGRVVSGPQLREGDGPVKVISSPLDNLSWIPLALSGPEEEVTPPRAVVSLVDLGGADRARAGEPLAGQVRLWAVAESPGGQASVVGEDWQGRQVFEATLVPEWAGGEGIARFEVPVLPRGLYRFASRFGEETPLARATAVALLGPEEERVSQVFDTLTPLPHGQGTNGIDLQYEDSPALMFALRDLGINFVDVHVGPGQIDSGQYDELLAFCKATGLRFAVNNESSNWGPSALDPQGRDRFAAEGGCHRWDLEGEVLERAAATGLFEGVVYDEGEHMQLCRNAYSDRTKVGPRAPYLVETTGMTLPEAYEAFLQAARKVREYNQQHGSRMMVESVFPALWHPLARAGVRLVPKLLKEDVHPVVLAMALGAAKQYDAELWFSPDFWCHGRFPGHPVPEYRAALRMAHAAGVDHVYTEYVTGLIRRRGATYDLSDYGLALREFIHEYLPARQRDYTYRDYEPEVAIVRFPDSDWGQASCYYWDMLYGAENLPPTEETGEWLRVWHLLTGGATHPEAVNTNSAVYPREAWRFAFPSPPVAVYDHLVGYEPLATVNTVFLCGVMVSDGALEAVSRRVREGATCFVSARLAPRAVVQRARRLPARLAEGRGQWVVVEGFDREGLGDQARLLPEPGEKMRLRFAGREVVLPEP